MSSSHLSDKELIEKLENVASLTNEDILSAEEYLRGRYLLSKAQDTLAQLNSSSTTQAFQSTLTLPEHVTRLSIALAPHKRLPSEILEQIFRYGSEHLGLVELPPTLSEYRWVLGRICSIWRRVSRSIPFWKTAIEIGLPTFGQPFDAERDWKLLKCASNILPDIAYICLSVGNHKPILTRALIPYLAHIKELEWRLHVDNSEQESMEVLPPGALSRLESLRVHSDIDVEIDLFGESSRLQNFLFAFMTPTFLFSPIPWSQLRSFILCPYSADLNDSWVQLAKNDPFRLMHSLEFLTLNMRTELFRIFLPCKVPWHRLKTLLISWHDYDRDLPLIMKPLRNCTSLLDLFIAGYYDTIGPDQIVFEKPILLPSLQRLTGRLSPSMIMSISSSGTLRSLQPQSILLQDFYTIVEKSPHLEEFKSRIKDGKLAAKIAGPINLLHLTSLDISFDDSLSFPAAIIAPLLTSLCIDTVYYGPDIVQMIVDFIIHSKMQLRHLSCQLGSAPSRPRPKIDHDFPSELLREFLAAVDGCHHVDIEGIIFPQQILDEVASGLLLSHTEYFGFGSSNPGVFLAVIQQCLERQATSGQNALRDIRGYVPRETVKGSEPDEELALDLKGLEEKYNVKCVVRDFPIRYYGY